MTTDDENNELFKLMKSFQSRLTDEDRAVFAKAAEIRAAIIKRNIEELVGRYGAVPPPWIYAENTHPMSIMWRMGGGESHIMVFGQWWKQSQMDEAERIAYFKKWPPPPRWMEWTAHAIWNLKPWEHEGTFDYAPYFAKLEAAGFEGVADFEADFNDDKWLRRGHEEEEG